MGWAVIQRQFSKWVTALKRLKPSGLWIYFLTCLADSIYYFTSSVFGYLSITKLIDAGQIVSKTINIYIIASLCRNFYDALGGCPTFLQLYTQLSMSSSTLYVAVRKQSNMYSSVWEVRYLFFMNFSFEMHCSQRYVLPDIHIIR